MIIDKQITIASMDEVYMGLQLKIKGVVIGIPRFVGPWPIRKEGRGDYTSESDEL